MAAASMMELIGIQALGAHGSNTPSSFTGSQSFLFSIQPFEAALEMNPLSALYWRARPKTKNVGKASMGANHCDRFIGSSLSKINFWIITKEKKPMRPPMSGLATHDMTTFLTTSQSMRLVEYLTSKIRPTPRIPPMMEWVVETGKPRRVATVNHVAAAIMAAMKPNAMSVEKASSMRGSVKSTLRMPFRTVSVTASPAKKAPANSNTAAMITACLRVKAREPTDVPMAFATSFAPMFQAMYAQTTSAKAIRIIVSGSMLSPP